MSKWDKSFFDQYDKRELDDKIGMRDHQYHGSFEEEPKFTVKKEVTHSRAVAPKPFISLSDDDLLVLSRMPVDKVYSYISLLSEQDLMSLSGMCRGVKIQKAINAELSILNHRVSEIRNINLVNQKLSVLEEKRNLGIKDKKYDLINSIDMSSYRLVRYRRLARESFRINKFLSGFESNGKVAQSKNFTDYQLAVTRQTTRKDNSKLAGFIDDHFVICRAARKNKKLDFIGIPEIDKRVKRLNDYISVQRLKKIEREYLASK